MENEIIRYDLLKTPLYPLEDVDIEATQEEILEDFKGEYEEKLKESLEEIGLIYEGIEFFSPRSYNYETDGLDLVVRLKDKNKFREAILNHKTKINEELGKNKSYDGYMALTSEDINEELENLEKKDYEPDVLVLKTILNEKINLEEFDYMNCIIEEPLEDEEI